MKKVKFITTTYSNGANHYTVDEVMGYKVPISITPYPMTVIHGNQIKDCRYKYRWFVVDDAPGLPVCYSNTKSGALELLEAKLPQYELHIKTKIYEQQKESFKKLLNEVISHD